jgi:hypothetical protein
MHRTRTPGTKLAPEIPALTILQIRAGRDPTKALAAHRLGADVAMVGRVRKDAEAEHVYKARESWAEMPGDHYKVSANASSTKPARLLPNSSSIRRIKSLSYPTNSAVALA